MERLVHIIPLGWDFDRAVLPVESIKAHRVYLMCDPSDQPIRGRYLERVTRRLKSRHIEVKHVRVDTFGNLLETMRAVSTLIERELAEGNRIFINVATSGKIAAIAATLAAMANLPSDRGSIYYVAAKAYPTSEVGQRKFGIARGMDGDPIHIPLFKLRLPDANCRTILSALRAARDQTIEYKQLIEVLRSKGVDGFRETPTMGPEGRKLRTLQSVRFHQRVVRKLTHEGLVNVIERGQARSLHLTLPGIHIASLCA